MMSQASFGHAVFAALRRLAASTLGGTIALGGFWYAPQLTVLCCPGMSFARETAFAFGIATMAATVAGFVAGVVSARGDHLPFGCIAFLLVAVGVLEVMMTLSESHAGASARAAEKLWLVAAAAVGYYLIHGVRREWRGITGS